MVKNEFTFQIVSLGSSMQQLMDSNSYINRPLVYGEGESKKWGDEYIIFLNVSPSFVKYQNGCKFIGKFSLDAKHRTFIKMFREIDIPIDNVDYYVVRFNVKTSQKIIKRTALIKQSEPSFSMVLSCAYDKTNDNKFNNELIIICKHQDILKIDNDIYKFDENILMFVKD